MKKIGIFYGSTTGTTSAVAEAIAAKLGVGKEHLHDVARGNAAAADGYEFLILGSSTWGVGDLQDDWYDFLAALAKRNLAGKTVAIFGCGDGSSFGSSFCDAVGIIHDDLQPTGCRFAGAVPDAGYSYDESRALQDGQFVGLPLDDVNEPELTDSRVTAWLSALAPDLA
ncbi:MAG: flavodoxin [Odoribacteraceae bacterium]|jgi:flavodoxin I|nr:flavodoxin [Odoribacteraceae bacterium]